MYWMCSLKGAKGIIQNTFSSVAWAKLAWTLLSAVSVLKGENHLDAANLDIHFLESRIVDMPGGSAAELWAREGFQPSYNLEWICQRERKGHSSLR